MKSIISKRMYYIINDNCVHLFKHKYLTHGLSINGNCRFNLKAAQNSDMIIGCNDNQTNILKDRRGPNQEISQEEFTWIKLSSVEM